jgi:hypothetical protein
MLPTPQLQNNEDDAEEGWGHWAMGNGLNNDHAMQLDQDVGLNNLLQAIEAEEIQEGQNEQPVQEENSGLTISISSSEGASSNNAAFLLRTAEEAQQPLVQAPNEQQLALGQNLIGVGLMNIIQAYQDEQEDVVLDAASPVERNDFMLEDVNML